MRRYYNREMLLLLNIAGIMLIAGLVISAIYELLALTHNMTTITAIVRPWLAAHKLAGTTIAALWFGASIWFLIHFYLP
jgi:DNA-binding transcriptional MerR regulator